MKLNRRDALKVGAGVGAAALLDPEALYARLQEAQITKPILSSGERIPVIGLGSWRTFDLQATSDEAAEPLEVVRQFHRLGGKVVDTAPSYGQSEVFVGDAAEAADAVDDLFLATKVNVQGRGADAALAQMEASSTALHKQVVDLMQVWNLGDNFRELSDRYLAAHLEAAHEWKRRGRARYVGITTSSPRQYDLIERALREHEMDFLQIDYSIGDREPENRILPLAADRGVSVLVNRPFTSGNYFGLVSDEPLPGVARDLGCESWAQFALKFIVGHPAVTAAIPATSDPEHLVDNMGAGRGRLPTTAERRRMVEAYEAL